MFAVIGGSGLCRLPEFKLIRRQVTRTPYGEASGVLMVGELVGQEVVFLARHGYGNNIPPHLINYRANIWALSQIAVDGIIAVASVGGIRSDLKPGHLLVPDQIIDYTWGRSSTFFEGEDQPIKHVDFTHPYDSQLRHQLIASAEAVNEPIGNGGCYACTQGPRLETAAEIKRLARDGAEIVGMTGMPEAVLARELNIPYAHIALVVNAAAGVGDSKDNISHVKIAEVLDQGMHRVMCVIRSLISLNVS